MASTALHTTFGGAPDIVFRGIDGNECEEFIAAIEELAFTEGWSGDRERMLLFARSRLRHKALRWFAQLDPPKKGDWDIFVGAIFDQYPLVDVAPDTKIATSIWSAETLSPRPSKAILSLEQVPESQLNLPDVAEGRILQSTLPNPRGYNPSLQGRRFGILRVISDEASAPLQYVSRCRRPIEPICSTKLSATIDRQEALLVCFMPPSKPHPIGCLNNKYSFRELSLLFWPCNVNSYGLHAGDGVHSPCGLNREGIVSNVWNVLRDGTIQASLSAFDPQSRNTESDGYYTVYTVKGDFQTMEVHVDTGASIAFVKPGTPLRQEDPQLNGTGGHSEVKARIVFEPL